MTWSAGKTAMTPVVERAPTSAAPSVTAAQVSRPIGSATTFSLGSFGNCLRTSAACASLVMIKIFLIGTSGSTRSTASCKKDFLPSSASSCLGIFSRLSGQTRSPRPPAMIMTKRSLRSVFAFIIFYPRISPIIAIFLNLRKLAKFADSNGFHRVRQRFHERADFGDEFRRLAVFSDLMHHRTADDNGIRILHDEFCLFGIGNAEANGDGQICVCADFGDLRGELRCN